MLQSVAVTVEDAAAEDEVLVVQAVAVAVQVAGVVQGADPTLSSSLTSIPAFSSRRARRACWSPRTSSPESQFMARSAFLSKAA